MSSRRSPYSLAPLLRQAEWEVDRLAQELAHAHQGHAALEAEAQRRRGDIDALRRDLKALHAPGLRFDLQRQRRLAAFLELQCDVLRQHEHDVDRAAEACETVRLQLLRARQAVQRYERHRSQLSQAHEQATQRAAWQEADERWMARTRRPTDLTG